MNFPKAKEISAVKIKFPYSYIKSFPFILLVFLCIIYYGCSEKSPLSPENNTSNEVLLLHTEGKYIKTSEGKTIRLTGVNVPSLEWSDAGENVLTSIKAAVNDWGANIIRLPVCQDRWFGMTDAQSDSGSSYRNIVDMAIKQANSLGVYIIIDLHWSDGGQWGQNVSQHYMPDVNSIAFWKDAAKRYANNTGVLFDMYNEPHDVSWNVWKNGGTVNEVINGAAVSYKAPGLQTILDSIRATGAKNIVIAGGLDWGYDLSGVIAGYSLSDPNGNGIIYSSHIYPWKGTSSVNWDPHAGNISKTYPVLIGEVGCQPDAAQEDPNTWAPKILQYIEALELNWTGWAFHPSASPCMISDWNYTPTSYWGAYAKAMLLQEKTKR